MAKICQTSFSTLASALARGPSKPNAGSLGAAGTPTGGKQLARADEIKWQLSAKSFNSTFFPRGFNQRSLASRGLTGG